MVAPLLPAIEALFVASVNLSSWLTRSLVIREFPQELCQGLWQAWKPSTIAKYEIKDKKQKTKNKKQSLKDKKQKTKDKRQ